MFALPSSVRNKPWLTWSVQDISWKFYPRIKTRISAQDVLVNLTILQNTCRFSDRGDCPLGSGWEQSKAFLTQRFSSLLAADLPGSEERREHWGNCSIWLHPQPGRLRATTKHSLPPELLKVGKWGWAETASQPAQTPPQPCWAVPSRGLFTDQAPWWEAKRTALLDSVRSGVMQGKWSLWVSVPSGLHLVL